MEIENLIKKYENTSTEKSAEEFIIKNNYSKESEYLKAGNIIIFRGGYNDDIIFKSKIIGFLNDKTAFVLWDCFWFPVEISKSLVKTPEASKVLQLMDKDFSYGEALNKVISANPELNRDELEQELNYYC